MGHDKQRAIQTIECLPDDASMDDILHELYFRMQVDAGLAELDAGHTLEHEDVKRRLSKWLSD